MSGSTAYASDKLSILLLLSDSSSPYQNFAKAFKQNLPEGYRSSLAELTVLRSTELSQFDLIVAVGVRALEHAVSQKSIPVLATLVPQKRFDEIATKNSSGGAISAIFIDQPLSRQAKLLHMALPDRPRIGVLYSEITKSVIPELRQNLSSQRASLVAQQLNSPDGFFDDLNNVLERCDVLFAIPDSSIYSSSNIRNILIASYRHGVPLIGISQPYVNAGALYAIFSTPEQLAAQASTVAITFARTRRLPEPSFPILYSIATNVPVAKSLGINLKSAELLKFQLEQTESRP